MNKYASLTPQTLHILKDKGTEHPFTGKYCETQQNGTYLCRGCGTPLFTSSDKFISSCGWPSFDDEIPNAINYQPDSDGRRTEILCHYCNGHLGHVFYGEALTTKNARYCVNSLSIDFVPYTDIVATEEIIVAGGCFWGVQHLLEELPGVLLTEVGYTGGTATSPSYEQVCRTNTGHVEAVRVIFDCDKLSLDDVIHYFFEIHNPIQTNGQGPDIGNQYLSKIFYFNDKQKNIILEKINSLEKDSEPFSTKVFPASIFWPAEDYHQHYYKKNKHTPYCHKHTPR